MFPPTPHTLQKKKKKSYVFCDDVGPLVSYVSYITLCSVKYYAFVSYDIYSVQIYIYILTNSIRNYQ